MQLETVAAELLPNKNEYSIASLLAAGRVALAVDTLREAQSMLDKALAYAGERK